MTNIRYVWNKWKYFNGNWELLVLKSESILRQVGKKCTRKVLPASNNPAQASQTSPRGPGHPVPPVLALEIRSSWDSLMVGDPDLCLIVFVVKNSSIDGRKADTWSIRATQTMATVTLSLPTLDHLQAAKRETISRPSSLEQYPLPFHPPQKISHLVSQ